MVLLIIFSKMKKAQMIKGIKFNNVLEKLINILLVNFS